MDIAEQFQNIWPIESFCDVTLVLGVSGGADSVALTRIVKSLATDPAHVFVAHFNHQLRGEDSDADEAFTMRLAESCGFQFRGERSNPSQSPNEAIDTQQAGVTLARSDSNRGEGLESLARKERYEFFRRIAKQVGARYIALAHTRDDQVETVLQRIFRGAGCRGLQGIPIQRQLEPGITLIRPLLTTEKKKILDYLGDIGQDFRTDESNFSADFTRNRIRHELIPLLNEVFEKNIAKSVENIAEISREVTDFLSPQVELAFQQHIRFVNHQTKQKGIQIVDAADLELLVLTEVLHLAWKKNDWSLQQMSRQKWLLICQQIQNAKPSHVNLPSNLTSQVLDRRTIVISENELGL